jgi:hypothetical protein
MKHPYLPSRRFFLKLSAAGIAAAALPVRLARALCDGPTYFDTVLATAPANLISYWPLDEMVGDTTTLDYSSRANNGTYLGPTLGQSGIGDGRTCPLFDGTNDIVNVYSIGLASDFDGQEGTMAAWVKVRDASVWTDRLSRNVFRLEGSSQNNVFMSKDAGRALLVFAFAAGGIRSMVRFRSLNVDWFHAALTWSKSADQVAGYVNGVEIGSISSIGAWSQPLHPARCVIGGRNALGGSPFSGWLAHVALWTTPLTADEIGCLAAL